MKKILIVEDDKSLQNALEEKLKREDYKIFIEARWKMTDCFRDNSKLISHMLTLQNENIQLTNQIAKLTAKLHHLKNLHEKQVEIIFNYER